MLDSFQNIFLLSQGHQFTTDELENANKESSASRLLHVAYSSKKGSTTNNKGVILIKYQNYNLLILARRSESNRHGRKARLILSPVIYIS